MVKAINYRELRLGKYDMPTWDGLVPVIVEIGQEKEEWKVTELTKEVADSLELPEDLRNLKYPKWPNDPPIIESRVTWGLSVGATAGIFERPRRGVYRVTDLGKQLLQQYGLQLNYPVIKVQEQFIAHEEEMAKKRKPIEATARTQEVLDDTGEEEMRNKNALPEVIGNQIEEFNAQVSVDLLERIRQSEPEFFEHLVVDLLAKMGYQGAEGNSVVTAVSRDGGIDGVINQDALGTSTVYVQAKRYQANNVVQRPAIEGFYGALSRKHADRGVFITTSSFSDGAVKTADGFSIVLIDGLKLTDLMLQYQVGVQVRRHFDLFQIDEDYFDRD